MMSRLAAPLSVLFIASLAFGQADAASRVPLNLALGKPATASGSEGGNGPELAVDGDSGTRWCAKDGSTGYTWQVDLGQPEDVTHCRIEWEYEGRYRYKLEGSPDGKAWSVLQDHTAANTPAQREHEHKLGAKDVRFVRVTVTGLDEGRWASIREIELFGDKTVDAKMVASKKNQALLREIKAPSGLKVTLFAAPPDVSYPVCLEAAPTGEVFVAVDPNGSLDQKAGRGKIVRCVDTNGDGAADEFKTFCDVDSPRGMVWESATRTMYVQHPPFVRAYHDDDGDGVADRNDVLVEGLGFDLNFRGADHTTNGMQIGIDGWLYVAVGDYGFVNARGRDGKTLQLYGGGVVRVRPDGTRLEIVSRGQRNIYDVAVSPTLDLFTRDNTNDGDGWDVRLSHVIPTGHYGYPSLFKNFPDEIVQPVGIYGGGSPTGSVFLDEPGGIARGLYTCDWGTNTIYRHPLTPSGAGFTAKQEKFLEFPRPIDMVVDGQSRVYFASWRGGGFAYTGPDVGYVARIVDPNFTPAPLIDLKKATDAALVAELASDSHTRRLAAQREILARGADRAEVAAITALANRPGPVAPRVAALFTLAQVDGRQSFARMQPFLSSAEMREFAIRAGTDGARPVPAESIISALADPLPRGRLAAVVALGRLAKTDAADAIVPLVADADPLVAHAAVNALVALRAVDACFAALDRAETPLVPGVIRVLQAQHDPRVVDGLIARLNDPKHAAVHKPVLKALCRLYQREAEWKSGWWGTRPDTSGPYYYPTTWDASGRIIEALRGALGSADADTVRQLVVELQRHKIDIPEAMAKVLELARKDPSFQATAAELFATRVTLPADAINLLAETALAPSQDAAVRTRALVALARINQPEATAAALNAFAKLPDDAPADMIRIREDFVRDPQQASRVALFAGFVDDEPAALRELAFRALLQVATSKTSRKDAAASAAKVIDDTWKNPPQAASLLRAIGRDKIGAYADQVEARLRDSDASVKEAAAYASARLGDASKSPANDPKKMLISTMPYEQTLAGALTHEGDAKLGAELYLRQGCAACHTVAKNEPPKGPFLGGIAKRYSRAELLESIVKPNAKIAQGFVTHYFVTKKRDRVDGFITRESGDEVEVRIANGTSSVLKNADVARKGTLPISIMPEGLADNLSTDELASLLAYLESLKAE